MRAAVFEKPGQIELQTVERPLPGEGELVLRVHAASICATDLKIVANGHFKIPPGTRRVLGHELAGVVVASTSADPPVAIGQRMSVAPNIGCGQCEVCVQGLDHLCPHYEALGITRDGGLAEYVRIPQAAVRRGQATPIPDDLSFEEAALVEPMSCVFNAHEAVETGGGDRVLIFGAGPMGLMHVQMARALGASVVVAVDPLENRRRQALSFGADGAVEPNDVGSASQRFTGGRGFDVVVVAVPSPEAQSQALEVAAVRGRINLFAGLPGSAGSALLDTNRVHYRQLTLTGTTGSSVFQYRRTMELASSGRLKLRAFISDRFPLAAIHAALGRARSGEAIKVVVDPTAGP